MKFAVRMGDLGSHAPPTICGGAGSPTVWIGGIPAWRGVPAGVGAGISSAKNTSTNVIKTHKLTVVDTATPEKKALVEEAHKALKGTEQAAMSANIMGAVASLVSPSGMPDIHFCSQIFTVVVVVPIPHGPGLVIDGSKSVLINGFPACRRGDTIIEAAGGSNKIQNGCATVLIGD